MPIDIICVHIPRLFFFTDIHIHLFLFFILLQVVTEGLFE